MRLPAPHAGTASPPAAAPRHPDERVSVIVVDDEDSIRIALTRFLRGRGYDVRTASTGDEGLALLRESRAAAMVCDIRMPGMSGMELIPAALALDGDLAIMMLSAIGDAQTATEALMAGALDYLTKPVELSELEAALERLLARRARSMKLRAVEQEVRDEVELRTAELVRERDMLRRLTVDIVEALINAQEAKDVYLRGHSRRVSELGAEVAAELALGADMVADIRKAGRLHDVGKLGVREVVLNKPGRLDPSEYEHVKDHVRMGMEILAPLHPLIGAAMQYVQDHHEHYDGTGYPRGLSGEVISLGGRVLCACDAFDALTSPRPYREPFTPGDALELLSGQAGRLVDPTVMTALRRVIERRHATLIIEEEGMEPG